LEESIYAPVVYRARAAVTNLSASAQTFQANVWIVEVPQAATVSFPVPTPDVTLQTNGIAYIGQQGNCITIGKFLSTCSTPTIPAGVSNGLKFSGLPNPNLHNTAANANTHLNNTHYGELIEFTGTVNLTNGQPIQILHDDGVALQIDGVPITGFSSGVNPLRGSDISTSTRFYIPCRSDAVLAPTSSSCAWLRHSICSWPSSRK
jgi:hypothetical protein